MPPALIIYSSGVLKDGGSICLRTNRGIFYIDNSIDARRGGHAGTVRTSSRTGAFGKPLDDKALCADLRAAYHTSFVRHQGRIRESEILTLRRLRAKYPHA